MTEILRILSRTMSRDQSERGPAEASLSRYETEIIPGFLGTLVQIASLSGGEVGEVRSWFRP
jgi:hypothetical protein